VKRLCRTTSIVVTTLCLSLWAASGNAQQHQQGHQQPHLQQNDQQQKEPAQQPAPQQQQPAPAKEQVPPTPQPPAQPPPSPPTTDPGPTKEQLDKIAQSAVTSSPSPDAPKPPQPALSFEPGWGLDLRADFLHAGGGSSRKLEVGLFGFNATFCRIKRVSLCGVGTVLMITSGADESSGNQDIRFVLTSPVSYSAEKHAAWSIYPYWDPANGKDRFGVGGGFSFNWKQLFGKLRKGADALLSPPTT
jgi:hypothetical protein